METASFLSAPEWCSMDTGQTTIQDNTGMPHTVYISRTRDGSVWIRAGQDYKSADWIYVNEGTHMYDTGYILDRETISLLESIRYTDFCVLTDLTMSLRAEGGWHPSYLLGFIPDTKENKILTIRHRHEEDCNMRTNLTLTPRKQGVVCGGGHINSCGVKMLPHKGQRTRSFFLKRASFEPLGKDRLVCDQVYDRANMFTFSGSFYHVYVKVAQCAPPRGEFKTGFHSNPFHVHFP